MQLISEKKNYTQYQTGNAKSAHITNPIEFDPHEHTNTFTNPKCHEKEEKKTSLLVLSILFGISVFVVVAFQSHIRS